MSRSYKRAVLKTAPDRGKWGKETANRKVRRTKDIQSGGRYKKVFCSYDIHDYIADMRFYGERHEKYLPRGAFWTDKGWMIPK